MLLRYGASEDGALRKKAHIYTQAEHGIDPSMVDHDAIWIVRRLRQAGFHAYIVGGAVRDILAGRKPKDFDVATDAHPPQIRRLFRSARLIGRRFRLVHVYTSPRTYVEVSTFRSRAAVSDAVGTGPAHPRRGAGPLPENIFGTLEEDAERRDFTINALYYSPMEGQLIDYVGGFPDIRHRRLRTLLPADDSFAEDPVRMIRAVKYASLLGFPVPLSMAGLIRRSSGLLLSCSRERMTEEVFKILTSGGATGILDLSLRLRVFDTILPALAAWLREGRRRFAGSELERRLAELDARARAGELLDRSEMFAFLFHDVLAERRDLAAAEDPGLVLQQVLRTISAPLFPSRKDLATAARIVLRELMPHRRPEAREAERRGVHRQAAEGERRPGGRRKRRRGGRRHRRGGSGRPAAGT